MHGFCVVYGKTDLDPDKVYNDKAAVQGGYWRELEAILHQEFPQYSRIECFDLMVSKTIMLYKVLPELLSPVLATRG